VMLIGRDAPAIEQALGEADVPLTRCESLEQAVQGAARAAKSGDAVLLSPACASLDMFRNYAHRAEVFVQAVRDLGRGEAQGDAVAAEFPQAEAVVESVPVGDGAPVEPQAVQAQEMPVSVDVPIVASVSAEVPLVIEPTTVSEPEALVQAEAPVSDAIAPAIEPVSPEAPATPVEPASPPSENGEPVSAPQDDTADPVPAPVSEPATPSEEKTEEPEQGKPTPDAGGTHG